MSFQGKWNIYTCQVCNRQVTTIDKDEGVTPFAIMCSETALAVGNTTRLCDGVMQSSFYHIPAHTQPPTFEWYKPTKEQMKRLTPDMLAHVKKGGLDLRRIKI